MSDKLDVYSRVTNKIVADLERGNLTWLQPWQAGHQAGPVSRPLRAGGKAYRGVNVLMLWGETATTAAGAARPARRCKIRSSGFLPRRTLALFGADDPARHRNLRVQDQVEAGPLFVREQNADLAPVGAAVRPAAVRLGDNVGDM